MLYPIPSVWDTRRLFNPLPPVTIACAHPPRRRTRYRQGTLVSQSNSQVHVTLNITRTSKTTQLSDARKTSKHLIGCKSIANHQWLARFGCFGHAWAHRIGSFLFRISCNSFQSHVYSAHSAAHGPCSDSLPSI